MLEARGLTKHYASLTAVRDVDFAIRPGEVLAFLGPNGAGKSTTVKMLVGLTEPSSGQILLDGRDIRDDPAAYKRRLGYVPDESNLYGFLSGWEYLELVATLREMPRARFESKAAALLREFTLYEHRHSPVGSYSKGMRQRILLIAALMHDPDVIVLDEPFSGLDVTSTLVFRQVLKLLAARRKAIFFSSPVLEVVEKICSHLLVLNRGAVAASGTMDEVRRRLNLAALEDVFTQLTEQADAHRVAENILASICS